MNETTISKDAPSVDLGDLHQLIASVAVTWCADECGINPEEWVYTFQSGHIEMSPVTNEESGLVASDIQDCLDHEFNEQQMEIDLDKLENAA